MLDNILRSGYTFTEDEDELKIKYMMAIGTLIITFVFFLILAIIFYTMHDILYVKLFGTSSFLSFIAILFHRVAGKQNYARTIYIGALFFFLLILYSYYLTPYKLTTTAWIVIQVVSAFLVLDITLALWITSLFTLFMFGNYIVFDETMISILLQISPVLLSFILVYIIDKKFTMSIYLLEDLNAILERRVKKRTSELEAEKSKLIYQAHYDFLTGLPNRNNFHNEIQKWIQAYTFGSEKFAVFFIDLDRFKRVNDSLGHSAGDRVLQIVAKRVQKMIPSSSFFSRISGDEFTLLYKYTDMQAVHDIAESIIYEIRQPIVLDVQSMYISASIGISCYPDNSVYYADLVKYADISMFEAKKHGRSTYKLYTNEMTHRLDEVVLMETELHTALEKEEFILYYQPQVDSRTGVIIGIEALVRWNHPVYGLSSPDSFIPLAEDTGVILILDYYILKLGMKQIVEWKKKGFNIPRISFNFSTKHLQEKDFVVKIETFLKESGCKATWIELEITESHVMENVENAIEILEALKALGISIAIDDFGVGYSSLSYLKLLPVDKLKIDKSFIDNIKENEIDKTICGAIINIGNSIGLTVMAEGVETEEQQAFLAQMQCHHIQGHLYYEALSASDLETKILI